MKGYLTSSGKKHTVLLIPRFLRYANILYVQNTQMIYYISQNVQITLLHTAMQMLNFEEINRKQYHNF